MNRTDRSASGATSEAPGAARSPGPAGPTGDDLDPTRYAVLQAFAELSEDALLCLDAGGRISGWNPSAVRIFGHPPDELLSLRFTQLVPPHFRRDVAALLDAVAAGERVLRFETELERKDRMPLAVSLSLSPVRPRAGSSPVSVVIVRDVTEQRLAQAALAEVELRMRDSEALAHAGSWLWDVRTGAVQWSDELHRIHGIDPLDFDGTLEAHLDLVDAADRDRVVAVLEAAVESGRPLETEYRTRRRDGSRRHVVIRGEPTFGSAGTVVGLRGIGQDVTGGAEGNEGAEGPVRGAAGS